MKQTEILLGADPEFFVRGRKTGNLVPIFGKLGGTKSEPVAISGLGSGFFYQEDGAAAEINIPPAFSSRGFTANIDAAMDAMTELLYRKNLMISSDYMLTLSAKQAAAPQANTIGCSVDHCAWDKALIENNYQRPPFEASNFKANRFAGCHLHLQYNTESGVSVDVIARLMDLFVGVRAVHLGVDTQPERRKFYGMAGVYRPKPYGIEYRSLSSNFLGYRGTSAWQTIIKAAFALGWMTNTDAGLDELDKLYANAPWRLVRDAMDREDRAMASAVCNFVDATTDWQSYVS